MSQGLLTIAFGDRKYIEMAQALASSYRRHGANRPIAVATDPENDTILRKYFDIVVPVRREFGSGVVQKLYADHYSPFDQTLFVDSDCLFYKAADNLWDLYAHGDFSVRGWRYLTGDSDYERMHPYEWVDDTRKFLQRNGISRLAHFNSGVLYFTKTDLAHQVFENARTIYANRESLGFVNFKNSPINDEPAFAVAIEKCGIEMDQWDSERGMETAINIDKITELDVLKGRAIFTKAGTIRTPTLLHFNVGAQYWLPYGRDILRLRFEKVRLRKFYVAVGVFGWTISMFRSNISDRVINVRRKLRRRIRSLQGKDQPAILTSSEHS